MSAVLELDRVSYSIAGRQILRDLDLEVAEGQAFAIAGVNGAGKSTLIKLALDLIRPSPGSAIRLFGRDNRERENRRRLAYLPEKFAVRRHVSGRQYLDFVTAVFGANGSRPALDALAERLDFPAARLDDRVGEYSKGMVQKLGLLSCFMLERPLLILDEPLSGLDPRARYCVKQVMRDEKSAGRTIVYSTHMLADAEELCDQFAILHDGELRYRGSPARCIADFGANSLEQAYMHCISTSRPD